MIKNCFIGVTPNQIKDVAEKIAQNNQDDVIVLAPAFPRSTHSPTKKKKGYRIVFEVIIPEEGIIGPNALLDFGVLPMVVLPKRVINPEFLVATKTAR